MHDSSAVSGYRPDGDMFREFHIWKLSFFNGDIILSFNFFDTTMDE